MTAESHASRPGLVGGRPLADQHAEVSLALPHQVVECGEVVGHPRLHLLLGESLGERHLDRAVEGERAFVHLAERVDGGLQGVGRAENRPTEPLAGDLDSLGERDLLPAAQERDLRHLGEVHPDRVVAGVGRGRGGRLVPPRLGSSRCDGCRTCGKPRRRGRVDQFDAPLFERDEQCIDLFGVDGLVGKVGVDLVEGEVAEFPADLDQQGQITLAGGCRCWGGLERAGG